MKRNLEIHCSRVIRECRDLISECKIEGFISNPESCSSGALLCIHYKRMAMLQINEQVKLTTPPFTKSLLDEYGINVMTHHHHHLSGKKKPPHLILAATAPRHSSTLSPLSGGFSGFV